MERAGFGVRSLALVIDILVLTALSLVIGLMVGGSLAAVLHQFLSHLFAFDARVAAVATSVVGFTVFLWLTMFVAWLLSLPLNLMEALVGWTPGKFAMGLRVRSEDGSRPELKQVLLRWLIKHNAVLISLLAFVGIPLAFLSPILQAIIFGGCFLALGPARQALHDSLTKTAVYAVGDLEQATKIHSI